jgi:YVTN family beta-propeller protein
VIPDGKKAYISNQWGNNISVVNLEANNVLTTIDLGMGAAPRVIVITPDGKKAYVTLPGITTAEITTYDFGSAVAVIDTQRNVVLSKIPVGLEPESIAMDPDGTRAYVSDGNANGSNPPEVHVIDTVNDVYLRPIILRAAATVMPTAIDITPDGKRLFVVSEGVKVSGSGRESNTRLLVVDSANGSSIGQLDIQPRGLRISSDGQRVYVFSPQRLYVVDSQSLQIIKFIDLSKVYPQYPAFFDQEAFRIVLNHNEDTAYLLGKSPDVAVVDLVKNEVIASIPIDQSPFGPAKGIALTPDGKLLLASNYFSQTVAVIDTSTNKVIAKVPVGNLPSEIKISEDGKRAYVLQQLNSTSLMTIIDIGTLSVLRSVDFTGGIDGSLDFELSANERYLYVACFDPNFVMVYDLTAQKVVKAIDVGLDPFNTVSTADKSLIYVTNFTSDQISVIDTTLNSVVRTLKINLLLE